MKRLLWFSCVSGVLALLPSGRRALAQGVTSGAVAGRITDEAGAAVASALVTLTNGSTGQKYSRRANDDGRYNLENVEVGGPYTLDVRALGFESTKSEPFQLALGQRLERNFSLKAAAVQVAGVTVTAEADPLLSRSRTGAQTLVSDSALRRLPTLYRSFSDFVASAPQVVKTGGKFSFTGQNDRFNNVQVDGTVNNDLFSLSAANGIPGGGVNARPISLEAVKEYQILVAPFDVRQAGFVGGLVNAVTKSGTNEFHGSAFGYGQNQNFVGSDTAGVSVPVADYQQQQYGFTLGGPVIRDRMHFFVTGDFRHDNRPFASSVQIGPDPNNPADTAGVGITQARADSVESILTNQYGFDPGSWRAPQINNPETNLFAKLDYDLGTNSRVEVSGTSVNANQDNLAHSFRSGWTSPPSLSNARDGYQLSSSGYAVQNETRTLRGKWSQGFGRGFSNELIVGRTTVSDNRPPDTNRPLILVAGNAPGKYVAAGGERFSQANTLDQRVVEASDNFTFPAGRHLLTVGTHNEFIHFRNVFFPLSVGVWNFASPAALAAGTPNLYARALPTAARPDGPVADFDVTQVGFYAQDRVSPLPNLTLTLGLRADVPSLPAPAFNSALDTGVAFPALGGKSVNTSSSPSGNILWSPRLGFNYDVGNDQATILRGGIGIFSGRPPYVWVANAYGNTGLEQQTLFCDGTVSTANNNSSVDTVPTFTVDPNAQPTTCGGTNKVGPSAAASSIVFYDQSFKFPQALKIALGADRRLPWNMVGTVDFIFTQAVNAYYLQDVNLVGIAGTSGGEAGRPLYGTISSTGVGRPTRVTARANDIVENSNQSKDHTTSLTAQIQKRFSNRVEFNVAYTYSHALDVISMTSDITGSNFTNAVLDGTLASRNLRTSVFDRPHKVTVTGSVTAPFDIRFSLIYNGVSGTPFTYMVSGDANADGVTANDPVYVPRNAADITLQTPTDWSKLDAFISGEPCLQNNRGRILPRNGCRNAWQNVLNARLSKVVPTVHGQSLEITADMLNVLNFINSSWGLIRQTGIFENAPNLIRLVGYDNANSRGIYALQLPLKDQVQINSIGSRWVFQLGGRYTY